MSGRSGPTRQAAQKGLRWGQKFRSTRPAIDRQVGPKRTPARAGEVVHSHAGAFTHELPRGGHVSESGCAPCGLTVSVLQRVASGAEPREASSIRKAGADEAGAQNASRPAWSARHVSPLGAELSGCGWGVGMLAEPVLEFTVAVLVGGPAAAHESCGDGPVQEPAQAERQMVS